MSLFKNFMQWIKEKKIQTGTLDDYVKIELLKKNVMESSSHEYPPFTLSEVQKVVLNGKYHVLKIFCVKKLTEMIEQMKDKKKFQAEKFMNSILSHITNEFVFGYLAHQHCNPKPHQAKKQNQTNTLCSPPFQQYAEIIFYERVFMTEKELVIQMPYYEYSFDERALEETDLKYPVYQICSILAVMRTLKCLHKHGIGHGDIKPNNIFLSVTPKKEFDKIVIADFGFACDFPYPDSGELVWPCKKNVHTGTLAFSPDYWLTRLPMYQNKDVQYKDLFSCFTILHFLLTGEVKTPLLDRQNKRHFLDLSFYIKAYEEEDPDLAAYYTYLDEVVHLSKDDFISRFSPNPMQKAIREIERLKYIQKPQQEQKPQQSQRQRQSKSQKQQQRQRQKQKQKSQTGKQRQKQQTPERQQNNSKTTKTRTTKQQRTKQQQQQKN